MDFLHDQASGNAQQLSTDAVVAYMSSVLRRGQLEAVRFRSGEKIAQVPLTELVKGRIPLDQAARVFGMDDKRRDLIGAALASDSTPLPDDLKTISVVISLVSLETPSGVDGLLLLQAELREDGVVTPTVNLGFSPWIPNDRMVSPGLSSRDVVVGTQEAFFRSLRDRMLSSTDTDSASPKNIPMARAAWIAFCLFKAVAEANMDQAYSTLDEVVDAFIKEHPGVVTDMSFIKQYDRISAVASLLKVYDYVAHTEGDHHGVLPRVALGYEGKRRSDALCDDPQERLATASTACGFMNNEFCLTDSQRVAVYAFLNDGVGDVTAVNGPPGTGKTTMLQSVVANMVTRHALEGRTPPVIVGTSTNNQAVTNIIDSFSSVSGSTPGRLDVRWLPKVRKAQRTDNYGKKGPLTVVGANTDEAVKFLGVYCPSDAKIDSAQRHYPVEDKAKKRLYKDYSNPDYIAEAREHFLGEAASIVGEVSNLEACRDALREELRLLDTLRVRMLHTIVSAPQEYAVYLNEAVSHPLIRDLNKADDLRSASSVEDLDKALDVTVRYVEFWLALHYFEAQWLLSDEKFLDVDQDGWKTTQEVHDLYWSQAPCLTPCFVMTVYRVPRFFELITQEGDCQRFLDGRIDLLIVDEAGQVDTPVGLPVFALASRAIVVGDEKQLSPIWSVNDVLDRELAAKKNIPRALWDSDLKKRGVTCSHPASLMRAASWASRWHRATGEPGLLLREHFRCHPGIIGYCNNLIYDGQLKPCRPAHGSVLDGVTEPMLFVAVPGSTDAKKNGSRVNPVEAEIIATWIVDNFGWFKNHYAESGKTVPDNELIAVVTPFSAQARLIKKELQRAAQAAAPEANLPDKLESMITVGTAHTLQGAERPVVLFSAVYGDNSPTSPFIDENPELMNVAVSRAKDLFIVFAAKTRWGSGKIFGLLARYAQQSSGQFAAPVQPAKQAADQPAQTQPAQAPAARPRSVSVSTIIKQFRNEGILRDGDSYIRASDMNQRLANIGVLHKVTGGWRPTVLAEDCGVSIASRTDEKTGKGFDYPVYAPEMIDRLRSYYMKGKL